MLSSTLIGRTARTIGISAPSTPVPSTSTLSDMSGTAAPSVVAPAPAPRPVASLPTGPAQVSIMPVNLGPSAVPTTLDGSPLGSDGATPAQTGGTLADSCGANPCGISAHDGTGAAPVDGSAPLSDSYSGATPGGAAGTTPRQLTAWQRILRFAFP